MSGFLRRRSSDSHIAKFGLAIESRLEVHVCQAMHLINLNLWNHLSLKVAVALKKRFQRVQLGQQQPINSNLKITGRGCLSPYNSAPALFSAPFDDESRVAAGDEFASEDLARKTLGGAAGVA